MEKLVSWIRENGGYVDEDIYMEELTPGNRTLKIRKEKPADTKLIDIPEKCCIKGETITVRCRALYKEFQNNEKSFYFPYLQSLPTEEQLSGHPLYRYTKKDVEPIFEICPEAGSILSNLVKNLELFLSSVQDKKLGKYCYVLVVTRSWNCMIPLIDLVQHGFPPCCVLKGGKKFLSKGLDAGQEMTLMYRQMSHVDLYITYGVESMDRNFLKVSVEDPKTKQPIVFLFVDQDFVQKTFQTAMNLTKGITPEIHKISACDLLINFLEQVKTKKFSEDKYPEIHKLNSITCKIVDNSLKILRQTANTCFTAQKELSVGPTSE